MFKQYRVPVGKALLGFKEYPFLGAVLPLTHTKNTWSYRGTGR